MNGWITQAHSGDLPDDFDKISDASLQLIDTTNQPEDVWDYTLQPQQMGSRYSKETEVSSHTSTSRTDVKLEVDDDINSNDLPGPLSPASSVSSQLSPAITTTPAVHSPAKIVTPQTRLKDEKAAGPRFADLRPRTSLPTGLSAEDLARQSILAAYSSRLNPFALHPNEYDLLRDHISLLHVSAYLNIRNRILRLWVRNPLVSVTAEEAAGCALSSRWLGLAEVAYDWLIRRGYINFGCLEIPESFSVRIKKRLSKRAKRKTIVVVGAGMSGLGCARQLQGLFAHYRERWTSAGEEAPRVIILEGRARLGGRVYSHPLRNQQSSRIPDHSRCTAEMGAHIITGFDHGNPLSMIIRGQLALHYHPLKDNSTLYDSDGQPVEKIRDVMVEKLFNDILDRASVYRQKPNAPRVVEGDRQLMEAGRDPAGEDRKLIGELELSSNSTLVSHDSNMVEQVPGGLDKLTGKAHIVEGSRAKERPAVAAMAMGWRPASSVLAGTDFDLDKIAYGRNPTLGAVMDEAVKQYQYLLDLSPQDMRLLNWHYANLEYANAANIGKLSLDGWDQDIGNEFEGEHAQVIGGYQQVPRGIWQYPFKLDLRTRKAVKRISYGSTDTTETSAKIYCEDGDVIEADHVVLSTPLGVLKAGSIAFQPELPSWKLGPIHRLGFGVLNKVILVYDEAFWDVDKDMFGLLREAENVASLRQEDYISNRGRSYLFWNCIKTSGRPVLVALMAGDAAHHAEAVCDADLIAEVTQQLARIFPQALVPEPSEAIVTRWGKDRFARGSYSYVAPLAEAGDYDAMAKPVGNLHFAGEATCGTHPATVHGAYISGLRAASEVVDALLGLITIPNPLVPAVVKLEDSPKVNALKRKAVEQAFYEPPDLKQARLEAFESEILKAIFAKLGPRPAKPGKSGANPFLLFSKDKWGICKQNCDNARRAATGNPETKASRNEVRAALGQMWREASIEVKAPYLEQTVNNKLANTESAATFQERLSKWDEEAIEVRKEYTEQHPGVLTMEEQEQMWKALGVQGTLGRAKKASGYAEASDQDVDV